MKGLTNDLLQSMRELIKTGMTVCDIGCNTGEFLNYARTIGASTFGVELSREAVAVCEKSGHIVKGSLNDYDEKAFDMITAFDLIEHLYDPKSFIESVSSRLKTNGVLVLLTGNINSIASTFSKSAWWYVNYPEHVVFPSRKFYDSLAAMTIVKYVKTYASKYAERQGRRLTSLRFFVTTGYDGRRTYFPDHHVVVLQKK